MSRLKFKTGDVFTVPIDDSRVGVGQIVGTYGKDAFYFAIFDTATPDPSSLDLAQATQARVVFIALSLDAKLAAGHWSVVGNQPVQAGMPLPAFKEVVGSPDVSMSSTTQVADAGLPTGSRRRCCRTARSSPRYASRRHYAPSTASSPGPRPTRTWRQTRRPRPSDYSADPLQDHEWA